MKAFRDKLGREWTIEINLATIDRVFAATEIDLTTVFTEATQKRMQSPIVVYRILLAVLAPQMEVKSVNADELGSALYDAELEEAVRALYEDIIAFFRREKQSVLSPLLQKTMAAYRKKEALELERMAEAVEATDFDAMVSLSLGGSSAGNSRASAESIPEPSPPHSS